MLVTFDDTSRRSFSSGFKQMAQQSSELYPVIICTDNSAMFSFILIINALNTTLFYYPNARHTHSISLVNVMLISYKIIPTIYKYV